MFIKMDYDNSTENSSLSITSHRKFLQDFGVNMAVKHLMIELENIVWEGLKNKPAIKLKFVFIETSEAINKARTDETFDLFLMGQGETVITGEIEKNDSDTFAGRFNIVWKVDGELKKQDSKAYTFGHPASIVDYIRRTLIKKMYSPGARFSFEINAEDTASAPKISHREKESVEEVEKWQM